MLKLFSANTYQTKRQLLLNGCHAFCKISTLSYPFYSPFFVMSLFLRVCWNWLNWSVAFVVVDFELYYCCCSWATGRRSVWEQASKRETWNSAVHTSKFLTKPTLLYSAIVIRRFQYSQKTLRKKSAKTLVKRTILFLFHWFWRENSNYTKIY